MAGRPLRVVSLGRRSFGEVADLQEALRVRVVAGDADAEALLLVEHDPVVTLGRRGGEDALRIAPGLLRARGIELARASRGGEATYHGPGQLVAYPIVALSRGVVAHVSALAEAAVATARRFGVEARFDCARPGVWVEGRKLASVGVHVHRRVASHGLALNVTAESLAGFSAIVPCGMAEVRMTSLADERGASVELDAAFAVFAEAFGRAIDRPLVGAVVEQPLLSAVDRA